MIELNTTNIIVFTNVQQISITKKNVGHRICLQMISTQQVNIVYKI